MGFLNEIVTANRSTVEDPRYLTGLPSTRPASRRSLREAIEAQRKEGALLAEYKRISPGQSEPVLSPRTISRFVADCEAASPAGYSCLATRPVFDGSPLDVLDLARSSRAPVLFKDFVFSPRQLEAAERAGASAVLLIARLARTNAAETPLRDLAAEAHGRRLEVLLELHAGAELSEVEDVAADMYGVNVRDLDTLRIERPTAEATIRRAHEAGLRPILGLSGVESPADAARFWSAGVDGILVGTALSRTDRPAELLRRLRRASGESNR